MSHVLHLLLDLQALNLHIITHFFVYSISGHINIMFDSGPNYSKLKTNLRLAVNRLKLLEKKNTELALKARREIADYIAAGKAERGIFKSSFHSATYTVPNLNTFY